MDLYEIDVTGEDIFAKGYGILILFKGDDNKSHAFGYRFSSDIQAEIKKLALKGSYGTPYNVHFKIRVYTTIICFILKAISRICYPSDSNFKFHICPDFAGHESAIIERIKNKTVGHLFSSINADNYIFKSHNKKSKIQQLAEKLSKGDFTEIHKLIIDRNELHNSLATKKNRKGKW